MARDLDFVWRGNDNKIVSKVNREYPTINPNNKVLIILVEIEQEKKERKEVYETKRKY
jgi:hypothetical protein